MNYIILGFCIGYFISSGLIYFLFFKHFLKPDSDIAKRIECFTNDINKQKRVGFFNVWAFCFSSYYFLYARLSRMCILFFTLPWILAILLIFVVDPDISLLIGFIISHLIAGFTANRLCQKYKKNYILKYKDADPTKPVLYRPVSIKRLIIMNFLTSGIYSIYWSYKNWRAYQIETKDDVSPFFRSWFCNLTMCDLFFKMTRTMKLKIAYKKYGFLFFILTALEVFLVHFSKKGEFSIEVQGLLVLISLFFMPILITLICLVPVQKIINQYAKQSFKCDVDKKFYISEILWLIFVISVNFIILFGNPFLEKELKQTTQLSVLATSFSGDELKKVSSSLGFIHRHVNGYAEVCLKENYEMKKYPNDFVKLLRDDIFELQKKLEKKGVSLDQALNELKGVTQFSRIMYQSIYAEFNLLQRYEVAKQKNIPVEEVKWNDELDNQMSFQDVCKIFDEVGIEFLKKNENRYFLKSNY